MPSEVPVVFLDVLDAETEALRRFREGCSAAEVRAVLSILQNARGKVACTGVGKSGSVANKLAGTLSSTGTPAFFLHPLEALHGDLGVLQEGDVLVALSKGGESDEMVRLLRAARDLHIPIVALVGRRESSTGRLADAVIELVLEREADPLNLAPTSSTLLAMAVGDALAIALAAARGFQPEQFAGFHPGGQLGRRLNYCVRDLLPPDRGVPLVGPEAGMRALLEEETRLNLGAVLVTDADRHLVGIVTDGDVRRAILRFGNVLDRPISDVMTAGPVTVRMDTTAGEAVALMENRPSQIQVLPVLDEGGRAVGLLRLHDVVRAGL